MTTLSQTSTLIAIGFATILGACTSTTGSITDDASSSSAMTDSDLEVETVEELVGTLQTRGHIVDMGLTIEDPLFSVSGTDIAVDTATVQVYEYADETTASSDAATIMANGYIVGNKALDWAAPPHFFQNDRLIVVYVGSDETLLDSLEETFGAQVAGGEINGPGFGSGTEASASSAMSAPEATDY